MSITLADVRTIALSTLLFLTSQPRALAEEGQPADPEVQGRRLLDEVVKAYSAMPGYADHGRYRSIVSPAENFL
jgi:hypothetical protein